ncbi:hypothetical protein KKB64_04585 [Patescibacteria group bacterium]|nr:hypothetical protein [Patescibacteria group bacterium]MBU1473027.1 hypothetical protein [Patescibacteria group bacterium]MBU2460217.1 hypothetical protein [Patescibacteria group bacterium]MBU2543896.1 hypothetical protein [Patescibacteria group bacterium]
MSIERGKLYNIEGLDATGKSTLAKELKEEFNGVMTYCPPDWMRPYRTFFNNSTVDMRFLYYSFSNFWVDKIVVQPLLEKDGQYVFQDRTWLTTLSAHEDMGASPFWLHLGLKVAKKATRPDIAFIIRVDNEVRRQRMMARGVITPDDLESLNNQTAMEQNYVRWTDHLRWNTVVFDNTHFTPNQARNALVDQINGRKP